MTELPESYKLTTVTTGNAKDCDIVIIDASHIRSEWIESSPVTCVASALSLMATSR